jgi:hypothetical protein
MEHNNNFYFESKFKNNDLICSLCNKSYNEIVKTNNTTTSENNSNEYLDKLKNILQVFY